jgi:hypothetical protein
MPDEREGIEDVVWVTEHDLCYATDVDVDWSAERDIIGLGPDLP